jgi:chromosome segregation ATPase
MGTSTSDKLRQTNENIIISEVRNLNIRVAELLEQFSLLTMEIGSVADALERQQVGVDTCKAELKELKEQFNQISTKLGFTQVHVQDLEKKLAQLDQRSLELDTKIKK